ncbi:MAG: DNA polymerase I [Methylococcaceae bacterium]
MSTNPQKRLILIDGSSFFYRAHHAIREPLTNKNGQPTGAIFGMSNMLRTLLNDYPTDYFTVVFDAGGVTFRKELYTEYKANRSAMPDELRAQIKPLHQLIKTMGLPLIIEAGVEADDVLGALAQYAVAEGFEVLIATGDKDMMQLVNSSITLIDTMSKKTTDVAAVFTRFGVKPEQIADLLALMGDNSDNIMGVPMVGEKTAAKWLQQYKTLEAIIEHKYEIKGKVGENLRANINTVRLAKQLTTIKCDLNLPYTMDDLKRQPINYAELREQLTELNFNNWLRSLPKADTKIETPAIESALQVDTIFSEEQLNCWLEKLNNAQLFAFDTETTSLDYTKAKIVGLSFAVDNNHAAYLPLSHDYPNAPEQLKLDNVLAQLKPLLENPAKLKLGQNLKYDSHVLANHGISLRGITHDTMLQSYVLNSTATKHNMDDLAKVYLGIKTISYEEVAGKGVKQISFNEVSIDKAAPYAGEDADITLKLHQVLFTKLKQIPSLEKLYTEMEIPLIEVLVRIERNGVLIDSAMLAQQSLELASEIMYLEQQAHNMAGHSFNLSSPKQIQHILYEQLKIPVIKKTPTGQPSTDEAVLQELALDYPLPKLILEHRSLSKLKSTYTDKLPQQIDENSGRIHTSYHQAVTATGRLSSTDPNLQNIPIRSAEGRKIRQAFIAPKGYKIVAADYSQIELRIMAHLSNDVGLCKAFSEGLDIHSATASEVFSVPLEQVTNDLRRSAKAINFGLIYGMSAFGLARQLGLSRTQAQSYIDLYFTRYPQVKNYMENSRELARQQGYVETLFGRRLYLPEIKSSNANIRQYAERTAINAPMQGTAADIIKRAMIEVDKWLIASNADAKLIMQVHDELVFEIADDKIIEYSDSIKTIMSNAAQLIVPLIVDVGVGNNWDEAH